MSTAPVQHERRAAQRFQFSLPVHITSDDQQHCGCSQDVSGRGIFVLLDSALEAGAHVEMVFSMPAEVTLAQAMRVRCRGRVLRVQRSEQAGKFGIAVCLENYTYLSEPDAAATNDRFDRIASLHQHHEAVGDVERAARS